MLRNEEANVQQVCVSRVSPTGGYVVRCAILERHTLMLKGKITTVNHSAKVLMLDMVNI